MTHDRLAVTLQYTTWSKGFPWTKSSWINQRPVKGSTCSLMHSTMTLYTSFSISAKHRKSYFVVFAKHLLLPLSVLWWAKWSFIQTTLECWSSQWSMVMRCMIIVSGMPSTTKMQLWWSFWWICIVRSCLRPSIVRYSIKTWTPWNVCGEWIVLGTKIHFA